METPKYEFSEADNMTTEEFEKMRSEFRKIFFAK